MIRSTLCGVYIKTRSQVILMMRGGSSLSRRAFLGTAVAVGTTGLAGCGGSSEEPEFRIVDFHFGNYHDQAHTLDATITESEEVVFEERVELGPSEYVDGNPTGKFHEFSGYPTEPGAYALEATVDDREAPLEFAQGWSNLAESAKCAVLIPRVRQDGSAEIIYSTTCDP
jgi:hypothetical protein